MPTLDDRYELSKVLGRGSTGTVWEAIDRTSSQVVAVKLLEPRVLASPHARKRFLREVETAGALFHPHVVEVFGHAETSDGGAYLVMERLAGKTLAAKLREMGPLPQPLAMRIIGQVLDAVRAAHDLGVVHRDLKPSNVMLIERAGDADFVKVCDFGLAKDIERDSYDPVQDGDLGLAVDLGSITEHGHICGTPEYMAPEQARGERVDERADLYAIAAMLYQCVVGRPPFSARSPLAVVSLHLTAAPPRPSEVRPDLGIFAPLESLILRGLAKDRAERPSAADVFGADLARIERDFARWSEKRAPSPTPSLPLETATLTLGPPLETPRRTRRLLAAGLGCAGILLSVWWSGALERSDEPSSSRLASRARLKGAPSPGARSAEPAAAATVAAVVLPPEAAHAPHPPPPHGARPAKASTLLAKANQALAEGRVAEACELGERASASGEASSAVWKFLGRCFMRLGEREKGIAYYRRYLEVSPSSPDAVFVREMIK